MTTEQFKQMRELLEESVRFSPGVDYVMRATKFLNTVTHTPDEWELYPVPVVIRDVVGSVQPIFGPRTNPLDDWVGGPG